MVRWWRDNNYCLGHAQRSHPNNKKRTENMKSMKNISLVYFPVDLLGQEKIHFQAIIKQSRKQTHLISP